MKRIAVLALIVGTLFTAAPSHAEDRIQSEAVLKVMPGARDTVFNEQDPIRICVGAQTGRRTEADVKVIIERRGLRDGATWKVISTFVGDANTIGCLYGVVHGRGSSQVRSRVLNSPEISGSVSRVVTLTVA